MVQQTPCINGYLDGMMQAITFFRTSTNYEEKKLTAQFMSIFLCIASRPGVSQEEIRAFTNVPGPTLTFILGKLGDNHRDENKDPLKWIIQKRSLDDYKRKQCFLTPKGQIAADYITNLLSQHEENK